MSNLQNKGLQYLVIIAEQKMKNKFLALLGEHGAHGIDVVYGHGSVSPSAFAAAFGFDVEQGKVLISCLVKYDDANEIIQTLYQKHNFNKPNTGIAYSISVEGLAF